MLRATIGSVGILEGWAYVNAGLSTVGVVIGVLLLLSGFALAAGLFTAVASLTLGAGTIGLQVFRGLSPAPKVFDTLPTILVTAVAVALALTGPGAWSIDAHRFGLREISVPRRPTNPD